MSIGADTHADSADAENKKPSSTPSAEPKSAAAASTQQDPTEHTREVAKKAKSEGETKDQKTGASGGIVESNKQNATAEPQPKVKATNHSDKGRKDEASANTNSGGDSNDTTSHKREAEIAKLLARRRALEKEAREKIAARRAAESRAKQVQIERRPYSSKSHRKYSTHIFIIGYVGAQNIT